MSYAVFEIFSRKKLWLICFILGIMTGIAYVNIRWFECSEEISSFTGYWMERISSTKIDKGDFQRFVFGYRIKEVLILFFFSITIIGRFVNPLYIAYCAYSTSVAECMLTLQYGYNGIVKFILLNMPHYIIYVVLIVYVMNCLEEVNGTFFCRNKSNIKLNMINFKKISIKIIIIVALIWLESFAEAYINVDILFDFI